MALASLVSFQKQKLTVVKIFMELDIEKRFFRGAISELLCHCRHSFINSVQNKHNYLWKNMTQYWHMQMHPDDQSFSEVLHSILENKKIIGLGKWAGGQVEKEDFLTE